MSRLRSLDLLIATLWVGSLWTVGYLVAPTLFATLADRALAGTIAASVFRIEAWLSLGCAAALLALSLLRGKPADVPDKRPGKRFSAVWLVVAMAACTLIGYFGLQPFMAAIRVGAAGREMTGDARLYFGLLHGAASVIYLVQSLLGGVLILKLRGHSV